MAELKDRNNPSFSLFPVNNNRTAWKPFGLPVILVVPHMRTAEGVGIANSHVSNVRIFIEDVPREARVAGHDHVGLRFPDRELYAESINALELADRVIDVNNLEIRNATTNEIVTPEDARSGDIFSYTTATGVSDTLEYRVGATYYDLSDILIDVELLPSDDYNLVYHTEYFTRVVSTDGREDFLCIDTLNGAISLLKFRIKHPGPVLEEFYRHTPPPYLTNSSKATDTTVELYRPFTDSLQNISDEQELLESINWVFNVPAEAVPYLSQLLGWDLPYFPESLDKLRRAVLRRTVEFQNLAGSRRAIVNLFRLFGFEILISNLWWSSDGRRFIRPQERLPAPYQDEEISIKEQCQIDIVLEGWSSNQTGPINQPSFGVFEVPLLFRPQEEVGLDDFNSIKDGGDVTIDAYVVERGSDAEAALIEIAGSIKADPINYGHETGCDEEISGFIHSREITDKLTGKQIVGYSQILISGKLGKGIDETLVGPEIPIRREGVRFDRENNNLSISLNRVIDSRNTVLYCFATYKKQTLIVPEAIAHLQSNRFDVQILAETLKEFADPITLEFALEFLFRLKAFHSLLNKIVLRVDLTETYEVTDLCIGGDVEQRYDTDIGMLQVPPAIIPEIPTDINDCTRLDAQNLGYKDEDITLRLRKLANMPEEHEIWKSLDDREAQQPNGERLGLAQPAPGREECKFTHHGQDRISSKAERIELRGSQFGPHPNSGNGDAGFYRNPDISPSDGSINGNFDATGPTVSSNGYSGDYGLFTREYTDIRVPICELDGVTDYCYKGRVDDELLYRPTLDQSEWFSTKPCSIAIGNGVYWTYPTYSAVTRAGVSRPCPSSKTQRQRFSGGANAGNIRHFLSGFQEEYLTAPYNQKLPKKNDNYLGRLYRDYDTPDNQTLHFTNRKHGYENDQRRNLALERPNLGIAKATLHLPGCRFITMNALKDDFSSPVWDARPWDDPHSMYCGPSICGDREPKMLNVTKEIRSDGNEYLVFDNEPYTALGNGLDPDIPSLGDHFSITNFTEDDVIHKVYMKDAESSPYVTLDSVSEYGTATDGTIRTTEPMFTSFNECNTGIYLDFVDGYASESGFVPYTSGSSNYPSVLLALGLELNLTSPSQMLFLLGSGILFEDGLRLDCGCLLIDCGTGQPDEGICSTADFIDSDGEYDWEPDHMQITPILTEVESFGTHSAQLDGAIPSMLETI